MSDFAPSADSGKAAVPISSKLIRDCIDDGDAQESKEDEFDDFCFDRAISVSLSFRGANSSRSLH
jgi:hypothetical protein